VAAKARWAIQKVGTAAGRPIAAAASGAAPRMAAGRLSTVATERIMFGEEEQQRMSNEL
jgi:hypothetical protein